MGLTHNLDTYVRELRRLSAEVRDEAQLVDLVAPHARAFAHASDLADESRYSIDPDQGFGLHLLHEEDDHRLAVFVLAWLPGHSTPPHNHKTWGVVVGLAGREEETRWRRVDDSARLERQEQRIVGPGAISTLLPEDIHSVKNTGDEVSLSLHTFGRHVNHTGRTEFDLESHTEKAWVVSVGRPPSGEDF